MSKVMNATPLRLCSGDPCKPEHAAEGIVDCAGGNSTVPGREKQVIIRHR